MGGVNGMLAEMDRDATVARLQAGKKHWRGVKRVEGRHPMVNIPRTITTRNKLLLPACAS
jgi:hypothetical protein